jgi:hypothetical protein
MVLVPRDALNDLSEYLEDDCRFDHHGYCQAHSLQEKDDCFMGKIRKAMIEAAK